MSHRLLIGRFCTSVTSWYKPGSIVLQCKRNKRLPLCSRVFSSNINDCSKAVAPQQPVDLLMQNLRSATDTSDILYNVQQHHAIMNDAHISQALQSLFTLQKSQQSSIPNRDLVSNESFHILCKILTQKVRFIELKDHLNALKLLSFIGMPSTNKTVQILLQLVSKQVNELNLQQIVFLDFLLKDFESCPLVDALKIAIPIVFEAHFRLQKEGCEPKQLSEFLSFSIRRKMSNKCIESFIEMISKNIDSLDVTTSKHIVRTLCEVKRNEPSYRTLLHLSLDSIIDNIDDFSFVDLNYILSRLTTNFNKRNCNYFYHEEFMNACADFVMKKELDDEKVTMVLRSCNKFRHMHTNILDFISDRIAENPSSLNDWHNGMLLTLVNSLSLSDYKPPSFLTFEDYFVTRILSITNTFELPWLRVALDLCVLDCWPHELFNTIFQDEFLNNFLKRDNFEDASELLYLYQTIVTLCPSYSGKLPSQHVIKNIISKFKQLQDKTQSTLLPALEHGLGGSGFVYSQIYTKLGHFIDHAVVLRKDDYSVTKNIMKDHQTKGSIFVEDIVVPENSQIILLVYLTPQCYTVNTEKVHGHIRLNLNTLEAMGFPVVTVMPNVWNNLRDSEKIPYLMLQLQSKCHHKQKSITLSNT